MVKKIAKYFIKTYYDESYHRASKNSALTILKSIESIEGKSDPKLLSLCDQYSIDVFGSKKYAPWLYVYSVINGKFEEGWIPENYYAKMVIPNLQGEYGKVADLKALSHVIFDSHHFPDLLYFTNGLWIKPKNKIITNPSFINEKFIYKVDNSLQGKGIYIIEKDDLNLDNLKILGNGVLQNFIEQHDFFKNIVPKSVATLRITTVIDDIGIISVKACYLRVGRSTDTHVKSDSHIRIPICISSGELERFGFTTNWLRIDRHPDTGFLFLGEKVPNFSEFKKVAISLHERFPYSRIIGWDMTLDNSNCVYVMEWNAYHNDIKFSEATQGPCFKNLGFEELWKKG